MGEVKRLEEELYCERQNTVNETSLRKTFECKLRELEIKYENNNMMISTNGKKHLEKLETKLKSVEAELELEKRKSRDVAKFSRRMERNYKDMEYQFYQEKRNFERLELQDRNRMYKKLADNAEEMASVNLAKLRRAQAEADLEDDKYYFTEAIS